LLEVRGVCAGYKDLQVLQDVSIEVRKGEVVAVIGSNASGKSTMLKAISGLNPPDSGEIWYDNLRIDKLPAYEIVSKGISLVPERNVFARLSVSDNLILGAYPSEARSKYKETLETVFELFPVLQKRRKQMAGLLSGGEQQMLVIGRALMCKPKLLMLDEPSVGLAPLVVAKLFSLIKQLNSAGITILFVEQNVAQALAIASRAYVLENGRIVLQGSAAELISNDKVRSAYLGI
jgi:branched-chain amino acid transport system ATP-binding protein